MASPPSSSSSRNTANSQSLTNSPAQTCLCSPINHPGSFRCSLHKKSQQATAHRFRSARPSKTNSWKAILMQIIRPSSHDLQRRKNFQPKPTRFSMMNSSSRDPLAVS